MLLQGWSAAQDLKEARAHAPALAQALKEQDLSTAADELQEVGSRTASARRATSGALWRMAGAVPLLGRTPAAVTRTTATADEVVQHVLPELLGVLEEVDLSRVDARVGRIDLSRLPRLEAPIDRALRALDLLDAERPVTRGVLPLVATAEQDLVAHVSRMRTGLRHAQDAVRLLPDALGGKGTRRYFVAFQGSAEARGTGGMVGAYGILEATEGRLSMAVIGDDRDLVDLPGTAVPHGPDYRSLYGRDPELWSNTNLSPHFPYAAQLWLDKWQSQSGRRLDGAIATDTTGLSHVLAAHGPVTLPGGEVVTGDDVVATTERDAYSRFAGRQGERKSYLVTLARAVAADLLGGEQDLADQVVGLARAAEAGRLLVYSAHPREQAALAGTRLAGEVPADAAPYAAVVVNNAAGNKLDYYLRRRVEYVLEPCAGSHRTTRVRVTLRNDVPPGPLPEYVSGRGDLQDVQVWRRGSTKLHVALYATHDAELVSAAVDGLPALVRGGAERGHPVFLLSLLLGRGQEREVVFTLVEPSRPEEPRVPEQPLVHPQQTLVVGDVCST